MNKPLLIISKKKIRNLLLGFLVLVLGAFIYNEIIVIPFFGCADNTKEAIKKREKLETEKEDKTKETLNELENIKKEK